MSVLPLSSSQRQQHEVSYSSSNSTVTPEQPGDPEILGKQAEEPQKKNDAPSIPPEGGRQGWLVVLGGFFCIFCSFGFLNAYVDPAVPLYLAVGEARIPTDTMKASASSKRPMRTLHCPATVHPI